MPSTDEEEPKKSECSSVLVSGLSSKTTKDAIQMYFENTRRSSGGDVTEVTIQGNEAIVTFESPKIAKKVLEWGKHTLDGCSLIVTNIQPAKPKKRAMPLEEEDPVSERSRVIRVTCISPKTTKDALLNFFENTRRSGGDEIEDIQHDPDEMIADITFCSAEVAERVAKKESLDLDGAQLVMSLKEIPKVVLKDPYKLHVMGLNVTKTTKDGIMSFMEVASKKEVESMLFGSNSDVMVTFKEPPDVDEIKKKCSTRGLDGCHFNIEQVDVCACIEVSCLDPRTTNDTILYYFENAKKGGGDVSKVEYVDGSGKAFVFFDDPSVVDSVTEREHYINDTKLVVFPYYPFLGETSKTLGGGKKEKIVTIGSKTMVFIDKFLHREFADLLKNNCIKCTWEPDSDKLGLVPSNDKMDKKDWEESCKAVTEYANQIVTHDVVVSQEAWKQMCDKSKGKFKSVKGRVEVMCKEKEQLFTLRGKKPEVDVLVEQLNDLKSEIEKQIVFEKNKITKEFDLTEQQYKLMGFIGFVDKLQAQYKDLEVTMMKKESQIHFRGPDPAVKDGNLAVWKALASANDSEMELSKSIVSVLSSDDGEVYLSSKFKSSHIDAVISTDSSSDETLLLVTGVKREDTNKAVALIKQLTAEQSITMDPDQKPLMYSDKWKELMFDMEKSMLLRVTNDPESSTLRLAGVKEVVDKAKAKVEMFLKENTILDKLIETDAGHATFLSKYRTTDMDSIEEDIKNQSVKVKIDDGLKGVWISGTKDGMNQAEKRVQKLIDCIKDRKVDLDMMPAMKKLFSIKKGLNALTIVENDCKCIVERCTPGVTTDPRPITRTHDGAKTSQFICSYVTPEGKTIAIYKGDLTEHKVDVMVNAANGRLQHIGGLAKAIVDKGGRSIQAECDEHVLRNGSVLEGEVVVTNAGTLPCKRLVHAVGPMWNDKADFTHRKGDQTKEERYLECAVFNSLDEAKNYTSIALPAISAGIYKFPHDVCANTLIESALEYSEKNANCKLSKIYFVDMNDSIIKAFAEIMKARFKTESTYTDGETTTKTRGDIDVKERKPKGRGRGRKPVKDESVMTSSESEADLAGRFDDPDSITTPQGIKISVVVGDLSKEEAHAIVNTVSGGLDLSKNLCAKALSIAAGPGLQQECKAKGSLSVGKILVTAGHNLGCKNVFHVVVGDWQNGQGEQVLRSLIQSCLEETETRKFTSIAFPAIGTGNLAFPRHVVAKVFFEEAESFKNKNPESSVNEVRLVLFHKDTPTVQAFQNELKSRKPKKSGGKRRSHVFEAAEEAEEVWTMSALSSDMPESFVDVSDEVDVSSSSSIGPVKLEIVPGDITTETTDAIVTVSNQNLKVSQGGGVGAAIAKAGGPSIQNECNKLGPQKSGSVVCTSAGKLKTTNVFHLVSSSFNSSSISDVLVRCFDLAESMGVTSISVPAVGTGNVGINPKEAAKALLGAIAKFCQREPSSVRLIRVVVFQEHMLEAFYGAIEDLSAAESKSGIWSRFIGWLGLGGSTKPTVQTRAMARAKARRDQGNSTHTMAHPVGKITCLKIFAGSIKDLNKAETQIKEIMKENQKKNSIDKVVIAELSTVQKTRILQLETKYTTEIKLQERPDRIVITGIYEDVSETTVEVYKILQEKSEEEHTRRYAELLSKNVQWYYMDSGDEKPYEAEISADIEQQYHNKKPTALFLAGDENDDNQQYKIDFGSMTEANLKTGDTTPVVRREAGKSIPLPPHWDSQPTDDQGKIEEVHLVVVDSAKQEYMDVKKAIESTSPINITKIERVQNPSLYRAYMVKKQTMDERNGANEKKLFHGTDPATCVKINRQGFNRNFCGKNAVVHGKGVYFARDAVYSMRPTYSPPDATGTRCMYLASVLVGDYTTGTNNMNEPPPKNPSAPTVIYDSTVDNILNPSIFVVFHDNQNYPDYLITFK